MDYVVAIAITRLTRANAGLGEWVRKTSRSRHMPDTFDNKSIDLLYSLIKS